MKWKWSLFIEKILKAIKNKAYLNLFHKTSSTVWFNTNWSGLSHRSNPRIPAHAGIRGLIHLNCILGYFPIEIMKWDPTQNENTFWVPPPSTRLFVTLFYLCVETVCFRHVSSLWITFYQTSLRDSYCGSRSLESYLLRTHILSICHWEPHRC